MHNVQALNSHTYCVLYTLDSVKNISFSIRFQLEIYTLHRIFWGMDEHFYPYCKRFVEMHCMRLARLIII